jgi:hypothetical protein
MLGAVLEMAAKESASVAATAGKASHASVRGRANQGRDFELDFMEGGSLQSR